MDHTNTGSKGEAGTDAQWTFMVYIAGDNDLESFGNQNLGAMRSIGSTDRIHIVGQIDRWSDNVTRRYHLTNQGALNDDCVEQLSEINTGDPASLIAFVEWAIQKYPAHRYALILWNHGSGVKEEEYRRLAENSGTPAPDAHRTARSLAKESRRVFFRSTIQKAFREAERGIAYDDSAMDFLDTLELESALSGIVEKIGRPLDLLGFDACFMSMVEVYFQLRNLAIIAVGSQDVEPGEGWPYSPILATLKSQPEITPEILAAIIVNAYGVRYERNGSTQTQSAVWFARINEVASSIDLLAEALTSMPSVFMMRAIVNEAVRQGPKFVDTDFVDLGTICRYLAQSEEASPEARKAANTVVELLYNNASLIHATTTSINALSLHKISGLSIYLPGREIISTYGDLAFSYNYRWNKFLQRFV